MSERPLVIEGSVARHWIGRMRPYRKVAPIRAVQINRAFVVVQNADDAGIRGEVTAEAGSWLAQGTNGVLYPITDESMAAMYEAIEEGQ